MWGKSSEAQTLKLVVNDSDRRFEGCLWVVAALFAFWAILVIVLTILF